MQYTMSKIYSHVSELKGEIILFAGKKGNYLILWLHGTQGVVYAGGKTILFGDYTVYDSQYAVSNIGKMRNYFICWLCVMRYAVRLIGNLFQLRSS